MPGRLASDLSSGCLGIRLRFQNSHSLGAATVQAALEFMTPGKTFEERRSFGLLGFFVCSLILFAPAVDNLELLLLPPLGLFVCWFVAPEQQSQCKQWRWA